MPEALALLADFVGEGTATEAGTEATAAAGQAATPGKVNVEVPQEVQDKQNGTKKKHPLGNTVAKVQETADKATKAVPSLSKFPTGGVALLLFIILLIVFAIPRGGQPSRLSLLWQGLLGNATLDGGGGSPSTSFNQGDSYTNPATSLPSIGGVSDLWGAQWGGAAY